MNRFTRMQTAALVAAGFLVVGLLGGCTAASSGGGLPPAGTTDGSAAASASSQEAVRPSSTDDIAVCTEESILSALPEGSKVDKFSCAIASPTMWAAAIVEPSREAVFLQSTVGGWRLSEVDEACGAGANDIPTEIREYCPGG